MLKKMISALAKRAGLRVFKLRGNYDEDSFFTYHSDKFRREERFLKAHARGLKTVSTNPGHEWRVHIDLWCSSVAARLEGDFVECGVFVGFMSSSIMQYLDWDTTGKTFYLVDTFKGPDVNQFSQAELQRGRKGEVERIRKVGGYDYSFEMVAKNFSEWKNVRFIQGLVPESLSQCPATKVAFLHLDMNCAHPEVSALKFFWDKLVPGGIVLMDDYTYAGYEEQHDALNAAAKELGVEIASLPTGQGIIIKPPQ